jgi:DNA-binding beta-propeller fold protein YncE
MALKLSGTIAIPDSVGSSFDHGAFDPKTRRVFVAHTGRDRVEVIDHDAGKHVASLPGFKEAAGVVADDGIVLVTNRGAASMSLVDAQTLETRAVFKTGPKPNGAAIAARRSFAIAASIGDEATGPKLHVISLDGLQQYAVELPGAPRWCVTDADAKRVFLAIREPSMVLVAQLPELTNVQHWKIRAGGAHGLEIDHQRGRLYVACDDKVLTEVDIGAGQVSNEWPIAGAPDVTFLNPATGLVHVAIGTPGLVESVDPRTGTSVQTMTGPKAHTTAIVAPDRLYVFSPSHGAALVFADV